LTDPFHKNPSSGLLGPFPLTEIVIEQEINKAKDWSSASVFALGQLNKGFFIIQKVSHADGDLAHELKKYLGSYQLFRYKFCRSTRSAYNKECELFHIFKPKDNLHHPVRPKNTKFECPVDLCKLSDS
ncbi:MAG: hypothetical protein VX617_03515, partial [Pseudomonadota bacterium]|nr:hypothetical protein [Pseudomonadota bacterium]